MINRYTHPQIKTGDFRQGCKRLTDDSVDLIVTDPPYPKQYLPLWADLARVAARVLKPGGFLVAYSGQIHLATMMMMLSEHLTYYWLAGLHHTGGQGAVYARGVYANAMKPILIYAKPPVRKPAKWYKDLLRSNGGSKQYHDWGQSVEPVRYLAEQFSEPVDLVLDPFTGGGTTAVACLQTVRRRVGKLVAKNVKSKNDSLSVNQRKATAVLLTCSTVGQAAQ
jgi:site-specific DNA-methyltransferase (adenine-specific)